jgi:uncharacterized protein DUF6289
MTFPNGRPRGRLRAPGEGIAVAQASPTQSIWILYYSDSTLTTVVGQRLLTCEGGWTNSGSRTSYYEVEYFPCDGGGI